MTLPSPTVSRLEYPTPLKFANALARAAEALGLSLGQLDVESILTAAQHQTGLSDWGDPSFQQPMRVVIDEAMKRTELTALARIILRQSFIRAVSNRLMAEDWVKRHPHIQQIEVKRPIFVLGFPRTGTTLLQNLLSLQEGRRGLPFWEVSAPVPVHEDIATDREMRRRTASRILTAAYQAAPEMGVVHFIDLDTLEECWPLFGSAFTVMNWELQSGLRAYGDWLTSHDMRAPYAEYKRYLQILLDRNPASQLVLKCPEHLWFVDALLDVFPDAAIVWTHRDPYDTVASYCSLMSLQWRTLYGKIDRELIGSFMEERLLGGIERAMEARTRRDPKSFFDVRFEELVADPGSVLRAMSSHFDLPLDSDHEEQIKGYLAKKRADERGAHKYDGRLYGLDRDELRERYKTYIDTFGIKTR